MSTSIGVVKRTEFGNLIVDLGKSEAIIKREELIPRASFKNGDRVRSSTENFIFK